MPRKPESPSSPWQTALAAVALLLTSAGHAAEPSSPATAPAAVPAYRQANHVAVISIEGPIDYITLGSLERRVRKAKEDGADAIVFELNTPGGDLYATRDINHLIRTECPANTVAWINPTAFSAGTIIALECREIVVAPGATFGDAAPIKIIGGMLVDMEATERAKTEGPLLAEVADAARRNGYDENLAMAFVSVGVELWMLENIATGERLFVDRKEYTDVFGEQPPTTMTSFSPPKTSGSKRVLPWSEILAGSKEQRETQSLEEVQAEMKEQFEDFQTVPPRARLTSSDARTWKLVGQVDSSDRLLTVKADQALFYGLAQTTIANDTELKAYFGAQDIRRYEPMWSEGLVRFLVSWPVRLILIVVFLIALFLELATPGMGVFGATAAVALLILIGAPALAGLAQWWDILLIGVGLAMVVVELFVLPGTGIFGVVGIVALLAGMVGTFVSGDIGSAKGQSELWTGLVTTLTSAFGAGIGIWLLSRHIQSLPLFNRLILQTELRPGGDNNGSASGLLEAMGDAPRALSVGDTGMAETDLRPSGRANIDGRLLDVKSVDSYIHKGTPIRVVSVGRFEIEVEDAS